MNLRTVLASLVSFALGVMFIATGSTAVTISSSNASTINQSNRQADREAIRAHIEKIFRSYVDRDCGAIRAAHAENWVGFTATSETILRGIDDYMKNSARTCVDKTPPGPYVMVDYKISDIDFAFYGDVALVPYIAETAYGQARIPGKLRSLDVYAKVNGNWIQVGSHLDLHPEMLAMIRSTPGQLSPAEQKALMATREATWRAIFSNDRNTLERVIPQEAIGIVPSIDEWANKSAVLGYADRLAKGGGKLARLEFPRTEVQLYGDVAILYSTYAYELNMQGKSQTQSGRATEIFVRRKGTWVNVGWHMDSGK